jgi:hypothetical protein
MSDPIAVFRAALAAVESEAWDEAASLCDPATLSLYKRELLARFEPARHVWTAERLLKYQPDMPREAAEFQAANMARMADPKHILEDEVPSISSVEELRDMAPAKVFAAHLEGQSHARQVERAQRDSQLPPDVIADALQHPFKTKFHVLGAVADGDRMVHIIFRREYETDGTEDDADPLLWPGDLTPEELSAVQDQQNANIDFAQLRKQPDGSWRMLAGTAFLGRHNPVLMFGSDDEVEYDGN